MNSTHAAVGVGGSSAVAMLTVLLTGYNNLDADHAAAAAWLIVTSIGTIFGLISWFIKWKWPDAPELPNIQLNAQALHNPNNQP